MQSDTFKVANLISEFLILTETIQSSDLRAHAIERARRWEILYEINEIRSKWGRPSLGFRQLIALSHRPELMPSHPPRGNK